MELTYDGDADQADIDRAILTALGRKRGYVVRLTVPLGIDDVVVDHFDLDTDVLHVRAWSEEAQGPVGVPYVVPREDIWAIHVY